MPFTEITLYTIVLSALAGIIIKWILDKAGGKKRITWKEFVIVFVIVSVVLAPGTTWVGYHIAKGNLLSFNENLNGWELRAIWNRTECTRDGSCRWEYDCDPYTVMVPYSCNCDKDGCDTCYRPETRYHRCPYCTEEWSFYIDTTLGTYTVDTNRLPDDPHNNRWEPYRNEGLSESVIQNAGVGKPKEWVEANARIESGNPGWVVKRKSYENYIYASQNTILKQYSGFIQEYLKKGLLPNPQSRIRGLYWADRIYVAGENEFDIKKMERYARLR